MISNRLKSRALWISSLRSFFYQKPRKIAVPQLLRMESYVDAIWQDISRSAVIQFFVSLIIIACSTRFITGIRSRASSTLPYYLPYFGHLPSLFYNWPKFLNSSRCVIPCHHHSAYQSQSKNVSKQIRPKRNHLRSYPRPQMGAHI